MTRVSAIQAAAYDTLGSITAMSTANQNVAPSIQKLAPLSSSGFVESYYAPNATWVVTTNTLLNPTHILVYRVDNATGAITALSTIANINWIQTFLGVYKHIVSITDDELVMASGRMDSFITSTSRVAFLVATRSTLTFKEVNIYEHLASHNNTPGADVRNSIISFKPFKPFTDGIGVYAMGSGDTVGGEFWARTVITRLVISYSGVVSQVSHKVYNTKDRMPWIPHITGPNPNYAIWVDQEYNTSNDAGELIYHDGRLRVIDVRTDSVVHDMVLPNKYNTNQKWNVQAYNYDSNLYKERLSAADYALYGDALVAHARCHPTNLNEGSDVIITADSSGQLSVRKIFDSEKVDHIHGADESGNVYFYTRPESSVESSKFWRMTRAGNVTWVRSYDDWKNKGMASDFLEFVMNMLRPHQIFDANNNLVFRETGTMPGYAGDQSVIVSKDTGYVIHRSAAELIRLPRVGSNYLMVLTVIDRYNAATDKADRFAVAVNTMRSSQTGTASETTTAAKFLVANVPIKTYLNIEIYTPDGGKAVEYTDYRLKVLVEGSEAYVRYNNTDMYHYLEVLEGQSYKVNIKSIKYKEVNHEAIYDPISRVMRVYLKHKEWVRNTYYISTPEELLAMQEDPLGLYYIVNDIDLAGSSDWFTMFTNTDNPFMGLLDGQGYTVRNLSYDVNTTSNPPEGFSTNYVGLIGASRNAQFKNLNFENIRLQGYAGHASAILCGYLLAAPLFDDDEEVPLGYEELEICLHNIHFKDCGTTQQYGYSSSGILVGELNFGGAYFPTYYDADMHLIDNCMGLRCSIGSAQYGSNQKGFIGSIDARPRQIGPS